MVGSEIGEKKSERIISKKDNYITYIVSTLKIITTRLLIPEAALFGYGLPLSLA